VKGSISKWQRITRCNDRHHPLLPGFDEAVGHDVDPADDGTREPSVVQLIRHAAATAAEVEDARM
jgi:hypothetical protein